MRVRLSVLAAIVAGALVTPAAARPLAPPWPAGARLGAHTASELAAGRLALPPPPRFAGVRLITGHERNGGVAFTFDDGPHRDTTPRVLAALAAHAAPAAFFVCGYQVDGASANERKNAAVLADVLAAGHLVGNHTFLHDDLGSADAATAQRTLAANEAAFARLAPPFRLFRAPYGRLSPAAQRLLADLGYTVVRWSIDPADYEPATAASPKALAARVLADIVNGGGGIVVLHDTKPATVKALPLILAGLEAENCKRLRAGREPILPVSLDYFATDEAGAPLPESPEGAAWRLRTRAHLDARCDAVDKARLRP